VFQFFKRKELEIHLTVIYENVEVVASNLQLLCHIGHYEIRLHITHTRAMRINQLANETDLIMSIAKKVKSHNSLNNIWVQL